MNMGTELNMRRGTGPMKYRKYSIWVTDKTTELHKGKSGRMKGKICK